jgi:hypothetical protein
VLRLPSGAATIDGAPCAYLRDDHGLASLLTAMAGAAAEREQRMAEPSRKWSGCSVPKRPLSSPQARHASADAPAWVVLGVADQSAVAELLFIMSYSVGLILGLVGSHG